MKSLVHCFVLASLVLIPGWAAANCWQAGTPAQTVRLSAEGMQDVRWTPVKGETHAVTLPNGFRIGLLIEPATREKYRELLAKPDTKGTDELVRIQLFDLSGAQPKLLSNTWGGANSRQGFGPKGGANGVPAMGQQIELWLHKPVCITAETLAAMM
ncbi:MAG: hypothetical protein JNM76_17555 [Betaproteobacteria bacterium]|nr:hypothetical protein [Betaproteobacteria bacterium]